MVIVEKRRVVSITAAPLSQDDSTSKLAKYFHDELKRRQEVD